MDSEQITVDILERKIEDKNKKISLLAEQNELRRTGRLTQFREFYGVLKSGIGRGCSQIQQCLLEIRKYTAIKKAILASPEDYNINPYWDGFGNQ